MNILHITDLHYSTVMGGLTKQKNLITNFLSDISNLQNKIDLVIFSGDLVNSGDSDTVFDKASEEFLEPILASLNLPKERLIICPGNHDVDRSSLSKSVVKYIDEEINDNKKLNSFFKKETSDLKLSYLPLRKYYSFTERFFPKNEKDFNSDMYSSHIREINGKKIGIISINSAWRAVGLDDTNNLLFPIEKLEEAIDRISTCSVKILVHHHPISDFKPYNRYELEDEIHKRFDFIFSGHIHKNALSIDFTYKEGAVKIGSSACLTFEKDSDVGYSILNINVDELCGIYKARFYSLKHDDFYSFVDKGFSIPTSQEKIQQNNLRKNIRNRLLEELENSKNLFVESDTQDNDKTILELSTEPVLKEKSQAEIIKDEKSVDSDFNWSEFHKFEKDYIIFGKDKCGKTILLKKIEVELLSNYSLHNYIPYYIDIKEWKQSNKKFEFKKEFAKHYYVNQTDALQLLNEKHIVLLLDNYHFEHDELKNYIEEFITEHGNVRLIICAADSTVHTFDKNKIDGRTLAKLHFHRLRKMHIKLLAQKKSDLTDEKQEQIVDKIDNIFKKLSIPFNYWTVSVFLWIFKKDLNANFQNDVDLINLYIERLIEKEQLTVRKSSFTFVNYKKLLAYLAHHLLTNYHQNAYFAKYSDIISFIDKYLCKNPRFKITSREVFDYLDSKGIFKKKDEDLYSFRLNGVFEYFIAHYMTIDSTFLYEVVEDKSFYLSFSNEFELYAGFKREDQDFLEKIYDKTKIIFQEIQKEFGKETKIDSLLNSKVLEAKEFAEVVDKFTRRLKDGLTEQEQDQIEEDLIKELGLDESNSDVKVKAIKEISSNSESLEASLQILGKVYKNIDDIDDVELVYEIFDYIVDNSIFWGFKLIDEFKDLSISRFANKDGEADAKFLSKVITNYIPTLVQVRLSEMISHTNLERIINERLKELLKDPSNNQYKIFLLSFMLMDINLDANKHLLETIIPIIRIPLIKYSFILKLNYYLAFKSNNNQELKRYLQKNIQHQHLKFNNDTDLGSLHKSFSEQQNKQGLIK